MARVIRRDGTIYRQGRAAWLYDMLGRANVARCYARSQRSLL